MSRQRDMRKRNQRAAAWAPICSECGQRGRHFMPPSLGERGFFACEAFAVVTPSRTDKQPPASSSEAKGGKGTGAVR